jgi:hypothetical protein
VMLLIQSKQNHAAGRSGWDPDSSQQLPTAPNSSHFKLSSTAHLIAKSPRGAAGLPSFPSSRAQVPLSVPAEIRPIQRLPGAYAVLSSGLDSPDPRVAARASHFANLEHGGFVPRCWRVL